jgi:hypothetical protein
METFGGLFLFELFCLPYKHTLGLHTYRCNHNLVASNYSHKIWYYISDMLLRMKSVISTKQWVVFTTNSCSCSVRRNSWLVYDREDIPYMKNDAFNKSMYVVAWQPPNLIAPMRIGAMSTCQTARKLIFRVNTAFGTCMYQVCTCMYQVCTRYVPVRQWLEHCDCQAEVRPRRSHSWRRSYQTRFSQFYTYL